MKNAKNTFWQRYIVHPIGGVLSRFPVPVAIAFVISAVISLTILYEHTPTDELFSALASLGLSFFLATSLKLLEEKCKKPLWLGYIAIIVYAVAMYYINTTGFIIGEYNRAYFTFLHILTFTLFVFWASYRYRDKDDLRYANFFQSTLRALLFSVALGIILVLLGFLAFFSVEQLFAIYESGYDKLYPIYATLVFGFFVPLYTLANFPHYDAIPEGQYDNSSQSLFVNKYILIPFATIYFLILYAYSIKVLLSFGEWPRGIISYLVMIFSLIAYFAYMTTKNLEHIRFVAMFRRYLPFAVFFQTFMLFYAIWLRIDQYGLTTNRYIIVLVGIILFALSLYFIISKRKRIVMIPALLSAVALFVSLGPWGLFQLPYTLQTQRFIDNMHKAEMFTDAGIVPFDATKHPQELQNALYSGLEYLCHYHNNCQAIYTIFADDMKQMGIDEKQYPKIRRHIMSKYNISYRDMPTEDTWMPSIQRWSFSSYRRDYMAEVQDVREYDYIGQFPSYRNGFLVTNEGTNVLFSYSGAENIPLGSYDFRTQVETLIKQHPFTPLRHKSGDEMYELRQHRQYEEMPEMKFQFENAGFIVSGKVYELQLERDEEGNLSITNLGGVLAIRDTQGRIDAKE